MSFEIEVRLNKMKLNDEAFGGPKFEGENRSSRCTAKRVY